MVQWAQQQQESRMGALMWRPDPLRTSQSKINGESMNNPVTSAHEQQVVSTS